MILSTSSLSSIHSLPSLHSRAVATRLSTMALPHPQAARKRKLPERKKLNVGQFIASEKDAYRIDSVLGSGGFGDVYKVVVVKDENKKYAMKTEYFDPRKRKLLNRLKAVFLKSETDLMVEMGVFTEIQNAPPARKKHFIQMVDKGQTDLFKFIVMEIVSHSLEDIRKYMLSGKLTWQTAIKVASQTLIAISDLHSVGYIHRDIKPHNFAIGRPPMHSQIYMLDFGIARRFIDKDGKIRVPRERVTFLGTVKFASRNCHSEQEQSRKDDLEVWIYMVLELFEQENLIWRRQTDRAQILQLKERLFTHTDDLDLRAPTGFKKVMEYVKKLAFADEPDYAFLDTQLWACAKAEKLDMATAFDWIDKAMPEKTKPKKKAPAARIENDDDSEDRRRRARREEKAKKKDRPSEGKEKEKKEGEEEHDDDDDEDEESREKRGSNEGGAEGGGKVRRSTSRGNPKKKSKDSKEVDVDPAKKGGTEKGGATSKMLHPNKHTTREDVSKMHRSKPTQTSDTKKSDTADFKKSEKQGRKSNHRKGDSKRSKRSKRSVKQRRQSGKEKEKNNSVRRDAKSPVGPAPTGPPPKNVSVMIQPTGPDEINFVKSGYLSLDMGPAGKK